MAQQAQNGKERTALESINTLNRGITHRHRR